MTLTYPTGTPLATTQAAVDRLEAAILTLPAIRSTITTTGTKPAGYGVTIGGNVARLYAQLDKDKRKQTNALVERIRELAPLVPGAVLTVAAEGGGATDPIYYTLSGPQDAIGPAADKLAAFIRRLPGTVNVQTGDETEGDRLNITIDRARAAVLGISPGTAAQAARIAISGAVATKVRTPTGLVDVRVQLPERARNNLGDIENINVRASDGSIYRLADVATFDSSKAPTKIERLDRARVVRVTGGFDPQKTTLGAISSKIGATVAQPGFLPDGVELRPSGDSEFFGEMVQSMTVAIVTSALLVYILMVILYSSFLTPFVVMFSIPVAIVGALFGLAIAHQTLNLFSLIALVMLFGLVAKNGILLVDYANTMRGQGLSVIDAIHAAAGTRLRPIVMTTMAMVFGMLPLALGLSEGAQFRRSMGTVLIGGLLSSLVLTLFLVPVMYAWVAGFIDRRSPPPRLPGEHQSALEFDDVPPIAAAPQAAPSLTPVYGGPAPLPREGTRAARLDSESAIARLAMPNLDGTLALRALGERRHVPLVGLIVVTVVSLRAASRMLRRGDSR
jgi:HAE1 family hydrophobic/amphiphilic exporter-1